MLVGSIIGSEGTGQAGSTVSPRLVKAAQEFEGQMMKEILKPMMSSDALTGSGDQDEDSSSGSGGALGEFATEILGQALSSQGGLGIANQIVKDLSRSGNQIGSGQVTAN